MIVPAAGSILVAPDPAENFPLVAAIVVAAMYWLGGRRFRAACEKGTIDADRIRLERRRSIYFSLGLLVLVFALQEPMDKWSDQLFWVHMVQHMLLIVVAAPLIVLGAPWMRVFKALPLDWRRALAIWALRGRSAVWLRLIARAVSKPKVAWALLVADILLWHVPAAYDLTLRSNAVHYTEHATFLICALIAWGHLIESPPFHPTLTEPFRIAFAFTQMVVMWVLGLALAFATEPWYSPYAKLLHRPGGISAITDQHLAGGIMWVPASLPWSVAIIVWVYRWVSEAWQEPTSEQPVALPASPPPAPTPAAGGGGPILDDEPLPALAGATASLPAGSQREAELPVRRRRVAEPVAGARGAGAASRSYPSSQKTNAPLGARSRSAPNTRRSNA